MFRSSSKPPPGYRAEAHRPESLIGFTQRVLAPDGHVVDLFRSSEAALRAAAGLNSGRSRECPHLPVGTRVQPGSAA